MQLQENNTYTPLKKEYFFAFGIILALFYINPDIERIIFASFLVYYIFRSIKEKKFFPCNPVWRGLFIFCVTIIVSIIFSIDIKESLKDLKYLLTALGGMLLYIDLKQHAPLNRPPIVWCEIGGMWLLAVVIPGYYLKWGTMFYPHYETYIVTTSASSGYISLMTAVFIVVNILHRLAVKKAFIPAKGYWIFTLVLAPILASGLTYYLFKKEYENHILLTATVISFLFMIIAVLWLYSGLTRLFLQIIFVFAAGYMTYLSGSRACLFTYLILLFFGINAILLMGIKKKRVIASVSFSCIMIILSIITVNHFMTNRRNRIDSWLDLNYRKMTIQGGYKMWKDYPITGVGFNTRIFKSISKQYIKRGYFNTQKNKRIIFSSGHAHNVFVHVLASTGIIGFCAFMYLCFEIFMTFIRHIRSKKFINIIFLFPFIITMIFGMTAHPFAGYRFLISFFTIGFAGLTIKDDQNNSREMLKADMELKN